MPVYHHQRVSLYGDGIYITNLMQSGMIDGIKGNYYENNNQTINKLVKIYIRREYIYKSCW